MTPDDASEPDPKAFREVLGLFATGVAVIATEVDGQIHAMTANAVSSLSLDPLLVLFCPAKRARFSQLLAPRERVFDQLSARRAGSAIDLLRRSWTRDRDLPNTASSTTDDLPRLEG